MQKNTKGYNKLAVILVLLWSEGLHAFQAQSTFQIVIALPSSSMHIGDELVVDVTTSNPTDHVIRAGNGRRGGTRISLISQNGEDVGIFAMGDEAGPTKESGMIFGNSSLSLRPGSAEKITWHYKPLPGHLKPGKYKLQVLRRDVESEAEVSSNVLPLIIIE